MITSDNIKVLLDFEKFGISSAAVLFHIIEFPKHGELSFGPNIKKKKVFSLAQLRSNKVVYAHNGKEAVADSFVFETQLPDSEQLPAAAAAARQRHLFQIRVLPVNDAPVLRGGGAAPGGVLVVAAHTRTSLPPDLLQVTNNNTRPLVITIMNETTSHACNVQCWECWCNWQVTGKHNYFR